MGISVADNFDHKSKKPLDARTSYSTLALMKAVTDANMNEGCLAYCAETDKYYKFLSTNTVDADTGKWREFESGVEYTAGDGIVIDENEISTDAMQEGDMDDVIPELPVVTPQDMAEICTPLPSAQARRIKYSTTEQVIGEWIDGSTIYQKTVSLGDIPQAVTNGTRVDTLTPHGITNLDRVINLWATCHLLTSSHVAAPLFTVWMGMNNTSTPGINLHIDATNIKMVNSNTAYNGMKSFYAIVQYTKTS